MQKKWFIIMVLCVGCNINNYATNTITTTQNLTDSVTANSLPADTLVIDTIPPVEPTLVFDIESYHMGLIEDNTKPATYSFFYCNVGQNGLIIKRIESTCGCTVTQYPTDSLYYDQSGQIDVAIEPCKEAGTFKKGIYVYTNAGTFRLVLSGEFAFADYSQEDYSAIPTEEEEKALSGAFSLSVNNTSTSSATEKKDKPIRQKKNKLNRKTKRLND